MMWTLILSFLIKEKVRSQQWFVEVRADRLAVAQKCIIQIINPAPKALIYLSDCKIRESYMHMSHILFLHYLLLLIHLDLIVISQQSQEMWLNCLLPL